MLLYVSDKYLTTWIKDDMSNHVSNFMCVNVTPNVFNYYVVVLAYWLIEQCHEKITHMHNLFETFFFSI